MGQYPGEKINMINDTQVKPNRNFDYLRYTEAHLKNALEFLQKGDLDLCKTSIRLATTEISEYEGNEI